MITNTHTFFEAPTEKIDHKNNNGSYSNNKIAYSFNVHNQILHVYLDRIGSC